ncbi:NAD(P)/FAD-dependent oxidoreductase [Occultella aeris]|uniref:NADH dehydrogenase-like protein n=1 Tax=Occultella aeris TaxID=2761496 RepID=A0A7M4DT77_9MICO|nr:FAD-dependent oxidoreductase [Occultella aeris]VZO40671.1 NADH dehydrogenase-like protein [Occultella aeris]
MRRIVIVGGGYAGFYTAWTLERTLRPGEAELTVIDPRPYMTYQPFLPEVAAGSIEPRHAVISVRKRLHRTRVVAGSVTRVDHATRTVQVHPAAGPDLDLGYDVIAITAGAVTRTFPIPGLAEHAIGLKHVEEAIAIRDRLLVAFDQASVLPPGPERRALLTVVFVGAGLAGVEGFGELLSLSTALLADYPELTVADLDFRLVEAQGRILPEFTAATAEKVAQSLRDRGATLHLNAQLTSAVDSRVELSDGTTFDANLIVWTAGNGANPVVANHTDLPVDARGRLVVGADLRVVTSDGPVPDAWAAGDAAAVPDLAVDRPDAYTVPNAQHAVRQGRRLGRNIAAVLRGRAPKNYEHRSLGVIATLGIGRGVFQSGPITLTGWPAWLIHRGYHVLAVPTWHRKFQVLAIWTTAHLFGRDIVSLQSAMDPRAAFVGASGGSSGTGRRTEDPTVARIEPEDGPRQGVAA